MIKINIKRFYAMSTTCTHYYEQLYYCKLCQSRHLGAGHESENF